MYKCIHAHELGTAREGIDLQEFYYCYFFLMVSNWNVDLSDEFDECLLFLSLAFNCSAAGLDLISTSQCTGL